MTLFGVLGIGGFGHWWVRFVAWDGVALRGRKVFRSDITAW